MSREMSDEQLDQSVVELGRSAALISNNPKMAYQAELLAMVRRIRRTGTTEQIDAIRRHIREHRGQDHRPYINHVMGWEQ